ncbi:nucleotidyl transferase AbiEii/AbiGii toxin family protein [Candidatus Uhrbacteria bacterium]|nr:nucleotidyl transferase AbiEii/AbiGii toxin family protein [Candidatus Uhrbacteria bacterium]
MEQTILTPLQQQVLALVNQAPELNHFYLSGGTALAAFYLHHRFSDDLDFFITEDPDPIAIEGGVKTISQIVGALETRFEKLHDRRMFFLKTNVGELKLEFTKYPFAQLNPVETVRGVQVDSLRDVSANKLAALIDRFDPKDFVDLYFILQQTPLEDVRRDTEQKFGLKLSSLFLGGELAKVKRIEALPRMVKPLTTTELHAFFTNQAKQLLPNVLDI